MNVYLSPQINDHFSDTRPVTSCLMLYLMLFFTWDIQYLSVVRSSVVVVDIFATRWGHLHYQKL